MPEIPLTEGNMLDCPVGGAVKVHINLRELVDQIEFLLRCYCSFAENWYGLGVEESNGNLKEGEALAKGPMSWFSHLENRDN